MLIITSCQCHAYCTSTWSFQEMCSSCNIGTHQHPSFSTAEKISAPNGSNQPWPTSHFYLLITDKTLYLNQEHRLGGYIGHEGNQRTYKIQVKRSTKRAKLDKGLHGWPKLKLIKVTACRKRKKRKHVQPGYCRQGEGACRKCIKALLGQMENLVLVNSGSKCHSLPFY